VVVVARPPVGVVVSLPAVVLGGVALAAVTVAGSVAGVEVRLLGGAVALAAAVAVVVVVPGVA